MNLALSRLNALTSSILEAFETLGLSIEEIAKTQELEEVVVKSVLLQYSEKYRSLVKNNESIKEEDLVTKEETRGYLNAYKMLSNSDDDYLRERVLRNLINVGLKVTDGLGESNPRKLLQELNSTGNILALNDILQKARVAKEKAMEGLNKIIDIECNDIPKV